MEENATCSTTRTEENCLVKQFTSILALIIEIHVVLVSVLWEIVLATYRCFVPVAEKPVKGEIVMITGAGHGLGRELALLYASENAIVVCLDVNEEGNKETVATIAKKGYCTAHAYTCDVSNYQKVQEVVEQVRKQVGEVTILINNAAIMPALPLIEYKKEDAERVFDINVLGQIWVIKAVLPTMIKNSYGHIVAISSLCGVDGMVNLVPYCASKFAVRGLIEALRKELDFYKKSQIETTVLFPYIMDTGLAKKPKVRFPALFPILNPAEAAKLVMKCQRRGVYESAIPPHYSFLHIVKRLPCKAQKILNEFMKTYVEAN